MKNITMIPGDGIGPEISQVTMDIVSAACKNINWEVVNAGEAVYEKTGKLIPDDVFESLEKNKIGIKGPITTPIGSGFRSINVALRKKYDLYSNIRPVKSIPGINEKYSNVDLIIFRENTEDLYAGIEEYESEDRAKSIKIITRAASLRIAKAAFEYAKKNGREKVTVVTKANIMKFTDGLFLDVARGVAKNYPSIELEEILVDNMAMQLVLRPEKFGVILTENLYGDILSDLCAGLVGGLGMVPGANIGDDMAVFEAVHGSAPKHAGKNTANPTALILSACMMLDYLDEKEAADNIRKAIVKTLFVKEWGTRDLGGNLGTKEYGEKVIENLEKK